MANYGIKIDLLKLQGAFMRNIQGKTATKKCIIIPVEDCKSIYLGDKGCYLNMTGIEMENPQFKDTHCIKGDIPKEVLETMNDEQRRALPIIGGMRLLQPKQQPQMQVNGTIGQEAFASTDDELPF